MNDDNVSFIILNPDCNKAALRTTVSSITGLGHFDKFCMVGNKSHMADINDLAEVCPVYKGNDTIISLIDKGLSQSSTDWNFVMVAGGRITRHVFTKYNMFKKSDKDILFPVIDKKIWFYDGSINGIYINKSAISEVGKIDTGYDDIQIVKLEWAAKAIKKGYKFKAIVGANLF